MRGHDAAGRRARRNESRPGAALPLSDQTPGGQKVRVASMRRKGPPAAALIHFLSNQNRHGLSTDRETGRTGASLAIIIAGATWPDNCRAGRAGILLPRMGNNVRLGISALEKRSSEERRVGTEGVRTWKAG